MSKRLGGIKRLQIQNLVANMLPVANLLLVVLNLLFLGTCYIFFRKTWWDFLWVWLACDHGNSFLRLEE